MYCFFHLQILQLGMIPYPAPVPAFPASVLHSPTGPHIFKIAVSVLTNLVAPWRLLLTTSQF